jgi:hypothetical protein
LHLPPTPPASEPAPATSVAIDACGDIEDDTFGFTAKKANADAARDYNNVFANKEKQMQALLAKIMELESNKRMAEECSRLRKQLDSLKLQLQQS